MILLLSTTSALAQVPWDRVVDGDHRVGLVVGEPGEEAEAVDEKVAEWLDEHGGVALRKVPLEADENPADVLDIEAIRDRGRELYFHRGADEARDYLEPRLVGRLDATRQGMGEPARSEALFEAGVYLVRACLDGDDDEAGKRWMERLVGALPAHRPDERIVPPDVVGLWESTRSDLDDDGSTLAVNGVTGERCEPMLNGAPFDGESVDIELQRSYLLGIECVGWEQRRSWWVAAPDGDALHFEVLDDTTGERDIEKLLERRRERWDLGAIVYVGPGDCGASTCLALSRRGADTSLEAYDSETVDGWLASVVAP